MENVVEPSGDRFQDVVENVKLGEAVSLVMQYVNDIVNNDIEDIEAQHCLKVLQSLKSCTDDAIGNSIA